MFITISRHMLTDDAVALIRSTNAEGILVPRGEGDPNEIDKLRREAGKHDMPVWFVGLDDGTRDFVNWFNSTRRTVRRFRNMSVRKGDE